MSARKTSSKSAFEIMVFIESEPQAFAFIEYTQLPQIPSSRLIRHFFLTTVTET